MKAQLEHAKFRRIVTSAVSGKRVDSVLYRAWENMRIRCSSNLPKYRPWYKDKGIKVCPDWLRDYPAFRAWALANGFRKGLTLDRREGHRGYYPANCRWVTPRVQHRNVSSVLWLTLNGVRKQLPAWGDELGISASTLRLRRRNGWSDEHILTVPLHGRRPREVLKRPGRKPRDLVDGWF